MLRVSKTRYISEGQSFLFESWFVQPTHEFRDDLRRSVLVHSILRLSFLSSRGTGGLCVSGLFLGKSGRHKNELQQWCYMWLSVPLSLSVDVVLSCNSRLLHTPAYALTYIHTYLPTYTYRVCVCGDSQNIKEYTQRDKKKETYDKWYSISRVSFCSQLFNKRSNRDSEEIYNS